jgi:hypothetical protein
MILLGLVLAAAVPVEVSIDAAVLRYQSCLRQEGRSPAAVGGAWETMPPVDSKLPLVGYFGRLIEFCAPERSKATLRIREIVKMRHPDWSETQITESAETVANRLDVDMLRQSVAPVSTSHGVILDY